MLVSFVLDSFVPTPNTLNTAAWSVALLSVVGQRAEKSESGSCMSEPSLRNNGSMVAEVVAAGQETGSKRYSI